MRMSFIAFGFCLLILAVVLACVICEVHMEEAVIDEWDPITPSVLYPSNVTGWAFTALTQEGDFLKLNISASEPVRIVIGKLVSVDPLTKEEKWDNIIFNQTGTFFNQKIEIAEENVDFLGIKNIGANSVNISGNIKKVKETARPFYSYTGLGSMVALLGLIILVYGILAKSRTSKHKVRASINHRKK